MRHRAPRSSVRPFHAIEVEARPRGARVPEVLIKAEGPVFASTFAMSTQAPSSDVTTIREPATSAAIQCGPANAESSTSRDASRGFAGSLRLSETITRSVAREGWIQ